MNKWINKLTNGSKNEWRMDDGWVEGISWRTCVRVTVDLHVDLLVEPFATVGTDEGPVVGVSAHVRV